MRKSVDEADVENRGLESGFRAMTGAQSFLRWRTHWNLFLHRFRRVCREGRAEDGFLQPSDKVLGDVGLRAPR